MDGVEQTSGETAADFSSVVEYKVTSENGLQTKTYRVTLQQAGGIIYVDPKATGRNNGSTWGDAFTSLEAALQKANEMPAEISAEIWMSKDCTLNNKRYELKRTLTLRGGFTGIETEVNQRNKDNKSVVRSNAVFFSDEAIGGTLTFDGIQFGHSDDWDTIKPIYDIKWDTADENSLVIQNCNIRKDTRFSTSARLASVTVKDVYSSSRYSDLNLPECDNASVDNCIYGRFYINTSSGVEPAQKVVIKNSSCASTVYAKDISLSNSKRSGDFYSFDNINLYNIAGYPHISLNPAAYASIRIKNCNLGDIFISKNSDEVLKLKRVDITNVTIADLYVSSGKVITERLNCSECYKITSLDIPACSATIRNCHFENKVDISCNAKDFKAIMEAVPVHTDIENVTAKTIKCGYVTGVTKEYFRTIKREYSCPPYVLKAGYRNIFNEPVPFASAGSHSLKDVRAENLSVSSGDSITLKGGNGYQPFRLEGQLKGALSFFLRWSEEQQINITYNTVDFSSVVLNNETTPNSKIDIDNIYVQGEWFRARTNTLSARNILPVWLQLGCVELQGHSSVTAADCNFRNLVPFYAYYDKRPTEIRPSLLAVGGTVTMTGCTFDETFVQVGSGTCFDTHLNRSLQCTVAVWKK